VVVAAEAVLIEPAQLFIDARSTGAPGTSTDEHLYIRRERALREVATALLLDIERLHERRRCLIRRARADVRRRRRSFSFGLRDAPPAEPSGGCWTSPRTRALMGERCRSWRRVRHLRLLGRGPRRVEFYVAKELHDARRRGPWAALAAMEPPPLHADGARHPPCRHQARGVAARTKLLIVVSDATRRTRTTGRRAATTATASTTTARALLEAERARISTFCVTVDPAGHDYCARWRRRTATS